MATEVPSERLRRVHVNDTADVVPAFLQVSLRPCHLKVIDIYDQEKLHIWVVENALRYFRKNLNPTIALQQRGTVVLPDPPGPDVRKEPT